MALGVDSQERRTDPAMCDLRVCRGQAVHRVREQLVGRRQPVDVALFVLLVDQVRDRGGTQRLGRNEERALRIGARTERHDEVLVVDRAGDLHGAPCRVHHIGPDHLRRHRPQRDGALRLLILGRVDHDRAEHRAQPFNLETPAHHRTRTEHGAGREPGDRCILHDARRVPV